MDELADTFETLETVEEHLERAEGLREEVEDEVQAVVEELIDDTTTVEAVKADDEAKKIVVRLRHDGLLDELEEQLGDDGKAVYELGTSTIQIGDPNEYVERTGTLIHRDDVQSLKGLIAMLEEDYEEGAPADLVVEQAQVVGMHPKKAEHEIGKLKQQGEVYEPANDVLRTT